MLLAGVQGSTEIFQGIRSTALQDTRQPGMGLFLFLRVQPSTPSPREAPCPHNWTMNPELWIPPQHLPSLLYQKHKGWFCTARNSKQHPELTLQPRNPAGLGCGAAGMRRAVARTDKCVSEWHQALTRAFPSTTETNPLQKGKKCFSS